MNIERFGIDPFKGFSPEIGYYLAGFEYSRSKTREMLRDLTPAEIARRIMPEIYSIGAITLHLCECEYYWIQSVVRERELAEDEQKFAHMFDAMENDVDRGFDSKYLIGKLDAIFEMTRKELRKFEDRKLDHFFASRYGDTPKEFSLREILQRLADHEANHRGQMSMIKRVIRGE
jgi:uncharacterized damage-inducible protein DinB